jgi:FdrA protein
MSATVRNEVRRGVYLDSVALMRLSRAIAEMPGVDEAALMMGTAANKRLMADAGLLLPESEAAAGGDLVIGIRATNDDSADAAAAEVSRLLARPKIGVGDARTWRPRSIRAAVKAAPTSNLALISVAGEFATAEARKALRRSLNVMIFSDNVPVADEVALKREARDLGLLVMGPDCGTSIIAGTALGFANAVPAGDIGIVGASGTGIQEVSCLIARAGRGISHAIGVGGRDLDEEVGGITTLMALDALDADPSTARIVLISKPPSPVVVPHIAARVAASAKVFTIAFIGGSEMEVPANAALATTLKGAAENAVGRPLADSREDRLALLGTSNSGRKVQGLYSGGTLCAEAQVVFREAGESVTSNAPIPGSKSLASAGTAHPMIDLGDDEYTRGRPHPMIDPTVRDDALARALDDPSTGVVLLDIVLGYGAHADPAGHLAEFLRKRRPENGPTIVASVTGTDDDPQPRSQQVATLEAVGVRVAPSNADAAALALALARGAPGGDGS